MKVQIKAAYGFEGPAIQYTGDDGYPTAVLLPVVTAEATDGRLFQLPNKMSVQYDDDGFQYIELRFSLLKARDIADAVSERRWIDADHWVEVTKQGFEEYLRGAYAA